MSEKTINDKLVEFTNKLYKLRDESVKLSEYSLGMYKKDPNGYYAEAYRTDASYFLACVDTYDDLIDEMKKLGLHRT